MTVPSPRRTDAPHRVDSSATGRLVRWAVPGLLVLVAAGGGVLAGGRAPAGAQEELVSHGRELYLESCVSCHGAEGRGVLGLDGDDERGPSLRRSGEASAYYWLSTGRMPLNDPTEEPRRKEPAFDEAEIDALVAYLESIGEGPALPTLRLAGADLAEGGEVYRSNCQACHSASGAGGALSYGRAAPDLGQAEPLQVAAAMRAGPGQMPTFGRNEVPADQLDDVVAYVEYLEDPADPGGLPIGRVGPVPEGFVAWAVGVVLLVACLLWIGSRSPVRPGRGGRPADEELPEDRPTGTGA
ncbi:MAG: cytochrome c class [Acidimicrobiales bacterium]|nr:cytochrome c class [Acidimicrobiales bacterium]